MHAIQTIFLVAALFITAAQAATVNFDDATPGQPPSGWTSTATGKGTPNWTVARDGTAPSKPNVLKQSGEATYPVCIKDDTSIKDGFVEVKFKPVAGKHLLIGICGWLGRLRAGCGESSRSPLNSPSRRESRN